VLVLNAQAVQIRWDFTFHDDKTIYELFDVLPAIKIGDEFITFNKDLPTMVFICWGDYDAAELPHTPANYNQMDIYAVLDALENGTFEASMPGIVDIRTPEQVGWNNHTAYDGFVPGGYYALSMIIINGDFTTVGGEYAYWCSWEHEGAESPGNWSYHPVYDSTIAGDWYNRGIGVSVIPEPATGLLALAGVALLIRRKRA